MIGIGAGLGCVILVDRSGTEQRRGSSLGPT